MIAEATGSLVGLLATALLIRRKIAVDQNVYECVGPQQADKQRKAVKESLDSLSKDNLKQAPQVKKWDFNWDRRNPADIYRNESEAIEVCRLPRKSRHIYLVRHGEYNVKPEDDLERTLTDTGIKQAIATGQRLKEWGLTFDKVVISTMTRARQTAEHILKQLPEERVKSTEMSDFIREGSPCPPSPKSGSFRAPFKFFQDGARIEAGFRKYFHRTTPDQHKPERLLVVCHANVIRYFLCRALQVPEDAWLRFSVKHGSITHIEIQPSGRVVARLVGDSGFMPAELIERPK